MSSFLWAVLLLVPSALCQTPLDQTRVPNASGSEVVRAVLNLIHESCIFKHDNLFLRRLAFVKTVDGTDPKTFLPNSGGIWQVNSTQFTQIIGSPGARSLFPAILSQFGIDWQRVTMDDLNKPLFSGIAAALLMAAVKETVPRSVEKQSAYYSRHFDSDMNAAHTFFSTSKQLPNSCKMGNLDLVFLVDTSASLSVTDFMKAKNFASSVIDSFPIGPTGAQVSFVTFSSGFKVHFNLNDLHTRDDIKQAIGRIPYSTGATETGAALAYVSNNVFMLSTGARPDASKVIILITDGRSTDHSRAVQAAADAKKKGILIFAIGVGNQTFTDELNELATEPNCTHVIQLQGYGDLQSLINEIGQESCKAPLILTPGSHNFSCQQSQLFRIPTSGTTTITIIPSNGKVNIYGSFYTPTPSKAFSDFQTSASKQTGAIAFVTHGNKPLYLNVTADVLGGCTGQFLISLQGLNTVIPNAVVTCFDSGIIRKCSVVDVLKNMYSVLQPPAGFPNPCIPGQASYQPHPFDVTKFLYCAANGSVYIIQCPPHTVYERSNYQCIPGVPPSSTPTQHFQIQTTAPNRIFGAPCTKENIAKQLFFHPYPQDQTKYIDCTPWPNYGIVKSCPAHKKWDQFDLTCTYKDTVIDPIKGIYSRLDNICKNPMRTGDMFFFAHPTDPHKYIQCDQYGDAFVKTCPNQKYWYQTLLTCIPHGLFPDHSLIGKR